MTNSMKKRLNKRGFTLVELIVVIAIVAVLAVVGIPAIAGQVAKAKLATLNSNARTIATQASMIISNLEVEGTAAAAIKTAAEDADAVANAAGVDSTKFDIAIVTVGVDKTGKLDGDTGYVAADMISVAVSSVTVVDEGKTVDTDPTGKWTRTTAAPTP